MKIKHQSSLLMNTWIDSLFFFFFLLLTRFISTCHFFASQNSIWNTKTKLQSDFFFKAFSLAEIQYKNLQCCEFMGYYQQCTMGTFLLCSIYMFILHVGQTVTSKAALSNFLMLASVRKKGLLTLHSDTTSSSIWVNTATFPLNSYKQLDFFPLLNQPG